MKSNIPGNLLTTAMAVMPHTDVARALEMALSMDVPFWPQLPNYSYSEDMYVQAAEHFPGIVLDMEKRTLRFSMDKFAEELEEALLQFDDPTYFDVSETYSAVYHRFLALDLADRPAIRGQLEGPISFGFNIVDQDDRPIIFDDTVRPFMLEFMAKRINVQLARLKQRNGNAFMFVDEPGLQFLFSAMAGYSDLKAKGDLDQFFAQVDRPRGIHLCGNPDWDFLLNLDLDVLSLDVYTNAEIFSSYAVIHSKIFRPRRGDCLGDCAYGIRGFRAGGDSLLDPTPRKCLEGPVVQGRRPGANDRPEHALAGHVLPGQPGQGAHRGARLCRREPDGRPVEGQISAIKNA